MESSETNGEKGGETQEMPKREFPKPLEGVDWQQCRSACEAGLDLKEAANVFKVSYEALRKRSQREGWLHPAKVETLKNEKMKEAILSRTCPVDGKPASSALEALSTSLEGYRSRTLLGLAKLAEKGVSEAVAADLPVENWQDAKIAADIAMKLHQVGQEGVQVNVLVGDGCAFNETGDTWSDDESVVIDVDD